MPDDSQRIGPDSASGNAAAAFDLAGESPDSGAYLFIPGVFEDMPFDMYRAIEAMSQSGAKKILRSPLHFKVDRDTPSEPTDSMNFGTAVHCGVLEPDVFDARICCGIKVDGRTKEGKAARAEFESVNAGKLILSAGDFDRARRCVDAVLAHPAASRLLENAERERSLFWNDGEYGVPCKARLDLRTLGGVADLKTTKDASRDEFARSIATFGYDTQAAAYFSAEEHLYDKTPEFFAFVAVESEAPHAVAVYTLGSASIMAGARRWNEALAKYKRAIESGSWQGYPDTIETIELPAWKRRFTA